MDVKLKIGSVEQTKSRSVVSAAFVGPNWENVMIVCANLRVAAFLMVKPKRFGVNHALNLRYMPGLENGTMVRRQLIRHTAWIGRAGLLVLFLKVTVLLAAQPEEVTFPSGKLVLHGFLCRPEGSGHSPLPESSSN